MSILFFGLPSSSAMRLSNRYICSLSGLALVAALTNSTVVTAQDPASMSSITFKTAVHKTLLRNPELQVFTLKQKVQDAELETAGLKPAYRLGLELENIAGTGATKGLNGAELTVSLSSAIELGGQRKSRLTAVSSRQALLESERQVQALDLLAELSRRFQRTARLQAELAVADEAKSLAVKGKNAVRKRVNAGAVPNAELRRASASVAEASIIVDTLQHELDAARVSLATLWGDTEPRFSKVEGDFLQITDVSDFAGLYARAANNPDILVFASETRLLEAEKALLVSQSQPNVEWQLGIRRLQETQDFAAVAGISVPLFGVRRNAAAVTAADAKIRQVPVQREAALLRLRSNLYGYHQQLLSAQSGLKALRSEVIPELQKALAETREAYRRGRYSYLEWVSARTALIDARRAEIDIAAEGHLAQLEIERLTGEPLLAPLKDVQVTTYSIGNDHE